MKKEFGSKLTFGNNEKSLNFGQHNSNDYVTVIDHEGNKYDYPKVGEKNCFQVNAPYIELAQNSWEPVTGCLNGCTFCYAREIATDHNNKSKFPAGFTPLFWENRLSAPVITKLPDNITSPADRRVYVCPMGDLFGTWIPDEWIEKVFEAIKTASGYEYIFLTKNPARYLDFEIPSNCWLGASASWQLKVERILHNLKSIKFSGRKWIALQPMLEPIDMDFGGIDLVYIGPQYATNQPDGTYIPGFAPELGWINDVVESARRSNCHIYMSSKLHGQTSAKLSGMKLIQDVPAFLGLKTVSQLPKVAEQSNLNNEVSSSFKDKVRYSKDLETVTEFAKHYGLSAQKMNKILEELGIQRKNKELDQWELKESYKYKSYHDYKPHVVCDYALHTTLCWNKKGRIFLYKLLKNKKGLLPLDEE